MKQCTINFRLDPSQMKMTKQVFLTDFFNYKFLCVKIVANTTKEICQGHIDGKLKLKNSELFLLIWWLSVALQIM